MKKTTKIVLCVVIGVLLVAAIFVLVAKDRLYNKKEKDNEKEENKEVVVTSSNIELSQYQSDIVIKSSGTYNLTGTINHSVIIDAPDEIVTLNLNNATISSSNKAAIAGKNVGTLNVSLVTGTINTLTDGGESEDYDGALYSNGDLNINGEGTLVINGNQIDGEGIATKGKPITINSGVIKITSIDDGINTGGDGGTIMINGGTLYVNAGGDGIDSNKDAIINGGTIFIMGSDKGGNAAIDTENGYAINGGTVIALGTDMLEPALDSFTQKVLCFNLDSFINANSIVGLNDINDNNIISFASAKQFKTLIISTDTLTNTSYSLYKDSTHSGSADYGIYPSDGSFVKGTPVSVNGNAIFTLANNVASFGETHPNNPPQR